MKRKMIKRLITSVMMGMFIVNGLTVAKVDAITEGNNAVELSLHNLNPVPQNLEVKGDSFKVTSSINIKGLDVADKDAVRVLNELLIANNITINKEYNEVSTTLIIGEVDDDISSMDEVKKNLGLIDTETLRSEGYILATDKDDNNAGTIIIEGKDGDGTFYGVKTLTQLLVNKNGEINTEEVVISDEPSIAKRGIVEGFYGVPWTQQDRLDQIKFYGDNKMNTYIYAPKDDPYHRDKWREPYPESELQRMGELIETADENKVDFIFAISPGLDIKFDGDEGEADFQALMSKCESLYDMGVRSFAIYWDDIDNSQGTKQAEVLNRFNREFIKVKGDVKPLITVPKEYWTNHMILFGNKKLVKPYTKAFSKALDRDIEVMWTGYYVVGEEIPVSEMEFVNGLYNRQMAVWWNYPVNDYYYDGVRIPNKLALGPITGLDKNLDTTTQFFTMNPMEQAELSKITLATGADYSWNTKNYDYDKSWNNAIERLYGDLAEDMKVFANHSTRMDWKGQTSGRKDAPEVRAIMDSLKSKAVAGEDINAEMEALYKEFNSMIKAADRLTTRLPEASLEECIEYLPKLRMLGESGNKVLDMISARKAGNNVEANALRREIAEVEPSIKTGKMLSEEVVVEFVSSALNEWPEVEVNGITSITAPESVKANNAFDVKLGVDNLKEGLEAYAAEFTFTYNPEVFDFNEVTGVNDTILATASKINEGEVRIVVASLGTPIANASDLVNIKLTAKKAAADETLAVIASEVGDGEGNIHNLELANKNIIVEEDAPVEIIVSKVNNFKAENVTSTTVDLTWEAPNNTEGLVEYVIYKDGKVLTTVPATTNEYEVTELKANTIYGFKVSAKYSNDKQSKPVSINVRTKK